MDCRVKPGNDDVKSFSRRDSAPEFCRRKEKTNALEERGKAERREAHPTRLPLQREQQRVRRDALAFRRSTAALASADAAWLSPRPRFLRLGSAGCYPALGLSQSSELLAVPVLLPVERCPGPPGSGVYGAARGHPLSLRIPGVPSRKASLTSEIRCD